jgi:hypothetical protein
MELFRKEANQLEAKDIWSNIKRVKNDKKKSVI